MSMRRMSYIASLLLVLVACGGGGHEELPNDDGDEQILPGLGGRRPGDGTVSLGEQDAGLDADVQVEVTGDAGPMAGSGGGEAGSSGEAGAGEAGSAGEAGTGGSGEAGSAGTGGMGGTGEAGMAGSGVQPFVPEHSMFVGTWDYAYVAFTGPECPEPTVAEMMLRAEDATYGCPNAFSCGEFSFDGGYAISGDAMVKQTFARWDEQVWVGSSTEFWPLGAGGTYHMTAVFWLVSENEMFGFQSPDADGVALGARACNLYRAVRQ